MGLKLLPIFFLLIVNFCFAQSDTSLTPIDTFESNIDIYEENGVFHFKPVLRPLVQIPGGRAPYYKYLWDFGDGHFSTQPEPSHQYAKPGQYEVSVYAVNNYDYGPKPKRPKKPVNNKHSNTAIASIHPNNFEQNFFNSNGIFQIYKLSDAKPGEDMQLVLGVNTGGQKGKVYILSNEKIAGLNGFKLAHQSKYYQEKIDTILKNDHLQSMWATIKQSTFTKTGSPDYGIKEISEFSSSQQAVDYFKNLYGAYNSLSAYDIDPQVSDHQFSLLNLDVTEDMLVDTNAIVTITGVFIPENGLANVHQVDIPVVKSHDPNKMSVRPARMSYRFQSKNKTLTYKVQFQNDGEGDARQVRLEMFLPPEVRKETFRLKSLYPQCDTCATPSSMGCYQYYIKDNGALVFHFKDIALPGTASKTLTDPDSSKGFILFEVDMEKKKFRNKSFQSYTDIYFDKNPAITTNISTSRFRQIWSPIVTIGTAATFGTPKENTLQHQFKPGIQLGFGLAPMAPYKKPFWQVEIYTSYYSRTSTTGRQDDKGVISFQENGRDVKYEYQASDSTINRDFLSVQLPVQIRYNISSLLSIGAGVALRKDYNVKYSNTKNFYYASAQGTEENVYTQENINMEKENSPIKYNPFLDINIGRVYMGPAIGFRLSYDKNQKSYSGIYGIWRF
ncbi:PKD domain-containing protein [Sphingobacterium bovistauri]|uniref:PKD domain-containing protein n=1 Tax=Sphingobacterium bovistauri TaxID=2781959 RepID=A0ABS7ZCI4_9SPHI|nr:PKD domain-containing protein [Sphingobacterium bovistauri]MCA5006434.1 PKD domain-containing protein [Sphingobacterium bovistauri]